MAKKAKSVYIKSEWKRVSELARAVLLLWCESIVEQKVKPR